MPAAPSGASGTVASTTPAAASTAAPKTTASATATPAAASTVAAAQAGQVVKIGDTVSVTYTGTLDDGTKFDSNVGGAPLSFKVGAGQMIAGFDRAVVGMKVGETKKVHLDAKDAYGDRRTDLVMSFPAAQAPAGLKVGQRVSLGNGTAVVTEVSATSVTVDANPEFAGKPLNFEILILSVK